MKLEDIARDMPSTQLLYLNDSYLKESDCRILKVEPDDRKSAYLILDRSIFHAKSGGQPSDRGRVLGDGTVFDVRKVMLAGDVVVHWGKYVHGTPQIGPARMEIGWDSRYRCMKKHTAAHLFDHCLAKVLGKRVETTDSWVGDESYIGYRGELPPVEKLRAAEVMENQLIAKGGRVTAQVMTREEALLSSSDAPNLTRLPNGAHLRVVTIEGCYGIPCGGTHLKDISEIEQFSLKTAEALSDGFRVHFDVTP